MEQTRTTGETLTGAIILGSVLYVVGLAPILFCRICLTILVLFTGKWRKIGIPALSEGAFTGFAILWVFAAPAIYHGLEKSKATYDYEIKGAQITFRKEPQQPHAFLSGSDQGIELVGAKSAYRIVPNPTVDSKVVVMDGDWTLSPKRTDNPEIFVTIFGFFTVLCGIAGFMSGVFREH